MRILRPMLGSRARRAVPTFAVAMPTFAVAMAALVACGGGDPPSTQRYCDTVRGSVAPLNAPTIATADDIETTLALYRRISAAAPLSVEVEWATIVLGLETASTVVTSDQASMQHAADTARAAQRAIEKVQTYTHEVCGVDLGVAPTTVAVTVPTSKKP